MLFVGAGVSLPAPSCIPLLGELTDRVAGELGREVPPDDSRAPEEIFEEFAGHGLGVHAAVRGIVNESPAPNEVHRAIAEIAQAGPAVRIVTTNYDRHLEACLPSSVPVYEAPDLPGDEDFEGVVHLHGRVGEEPSRLIVTKSDFAEAYMQPLSPTLAFLHRMFASKTVLFVGYSADDALMQYVLRGARGRTDLLTLHARPEDPKWDALDIVAVGYGHHDDLPLVLGHWAQRTSATRDQHVDWVTRILTECESLDGLSELDESYLADVISDPDLVGVFTRIARGPVWIRWVAERANTALFAPTSENLSNVDDALLLWFLEHFNDDDDTANAVLGALVDCHGHIHSRLWANLVMRLDFRGGASEEAIARLRLVLADTAPVALGADRFSHLTNLLRWDDLSDNEYLELVDRVCAPAIQPLRGEWSWLDPSAVFTTTSHDPSSGPAASDPDGGFWTRRPHLVPDLLSIIDAHIRRVCRIESIAGNANPFASRAAVEPHEQNHGVRDTDYLVDAARDLHSSLVANRPAMAAGYLDSWSASPWPILKRLAIHAWTERVDISADDRLDWLLRQDGWVADTALHHEVMRLIASTVHDASEDGIEALVQAITANDSPDISRLTFNRLGWIAEHAPHSPAAAIAFAAAQSVQPEFSIFEHPDHLRWIETSVSSSRIEPKVPPAQLAEDLVADAAAVVAALVADAEPRAAAEEIPYTLGPALMAAADAVELQPAAGIALLEAVVESADIGSSPVHSLVENVLISMNAPQVRSQLVESARDRTRRILRKSWDAVEDIWEVPSEASPEHGWHHVAINNWAGKTTELAIHIALAEAKSRPESDGGLAQTDRELLQHILVGDSPARCLAQAMCARYLMPLHAADRDWAKAHLLPLMDRAADEQRSVRCWDAYLVDRRWNPELLEDGLLDRFRRFAEIADRCCDRTRPAFAWLAAELCISEDPESPIGSAKWLTAFTSTASDATRTEFIDAVPRFLQTEDPQAISTQWHNWMHRYWQSRLTEIPRPLNETESGMLAGWVPLLGENAPAAVDLIRSTTTPLLQGTSLLAQLHSVTQGTGHFICFVDRYPHEAAQFMAHLLQSTTHEIAQHTEIAAGYLIRALQDRVDEDSFEPVRTELDRLGWCQRSR